MIILTHEDKKNPKDEPRTLKIERILCIFVSQLKAKSHFFFKFHPFFEILTYQFSCEPNFDIGLTSK